jgi:hypothetical protein
MLHSQTLQRHDTIMFSIRSLIKSAVYHLTTYFILCVAAGVVITSACTLVTYLEVVLELVLEDPAIAVEPVIWWALVF